MKLEIIVIIEILVDLIKEGGCFCSIRLNKKRTLKFRAAYESLSIEEKKLLLESLLEYEIGYDHKRREENIKEAKEKAEKWFKEGVDLPIIICGGGSFSNLNTLIGIIVRNFF